MLHPTPQKQYTFIHDALVEFIKSRSHLVTAAELKTHVTKMATVSANSNMTGFQQEYQVNTYVLCAVRIGHMQESGLTGHACMNLGYLKAVISQVY